MPTITFMEALRRKMSKLSFQAGKFQIEAWTDGHPMWMNLSYEGGGHEVQIRFRHNELKDLAHAIDRMLKQGRAAMPEDYKHEFD